MDGSVFQLEHLAGSAGERGGGQVFQLKHRRRGLSAIHSMETIDSCPRRRL
jgi:hypothetical protein